MVNNRDRAPRTAGRCHTNSVNSCITGERSWSSRYSSGSVENTEASAWSKLPKESGGVVSSRPLTAPLTAPTATRAPVVGVEAGAVVHSSCTSALGRRM